MNAFRWTLLLEIIFVVTAMAYIGLSVTWAQVNGLLRDRGLVGRSLLANLLLVPLLAAGLIAVIPMPLDAQVALILLALAPGGLNVLQFSTKIDGHLAQAAALLFLLSMLSLITTPVGVALMPMPRDPGQLIAVRNILAFLAAVLAPMALGALVRRHTPELAEKLARPINLMSTVSFVAAMLVGSAIKKDAAEALGGSVLLVLVLFVAGTWLIGWVLGGGDGADRRLLATVTSIRNAGLVLLFGITLFPNTGVDTVVLAYALLMILPNAAIMVTHSVRQKRAAHKLGQTPKV
ncbi:BASS family bile acid:Na+ symporter [Bradymonas sediminis]|uniref:Uncharacterized protein n=2 Tax=Bradymonas sediminis TaxID=1548548 RepID=A0A2Z4FGG2_9DELT|nr:hypothetical protein DN745_01270 [Bradymonas sediminis]TDP77156.1 BASS family bile acid:Na+ symporter [Bradymonas sediminis]